MDGDINYDFDGVADEGDWYFNNSSYDGTITLVTDPEETPLEHRLVWEYDLSGLGLSPPVSASLTFVLRGAHAIPREDVDVHVYSYPANLTGDLDDFSAEPAVYQGMVTVSPNQAPTSFTINVTAAVNAALLDAVDAVGLRFQVAPDTTYPRNQVFMFVEESDPTTKPVLIVDEAVPADADYNGVVDLGDYDWFAWCMHGPDNPAPTDVQCDQLKLDLDTDVDLVDFASFQRYYQPLP